MNRFLKYVMSNKLGTVTVALSLTYMFLGLPAQIWKIWEARSVEDISLLMFALLAIQSLAWVLYGKQKHDWFVFTANCFGTLFAAVIVVEYFLFK